MTKREKKRALQRERNKALKIQAELANKETQRRIDVIQNANKILSGNEEYVKHASTFELLTELIDMSVDELEQLMKPLDVQNTYLHNYINSIKNITSEQIEKQDRYFIDKSDENMEAHGEKCDFIYECVALLSVIPKKNRIKCLSTLKVLSK